MECSKQRSQHSLIAMNEVCQSYLMADQRLSVLNNVSLEIQAGESCAIVGASGSGKSTLLNIIGLLDQPISGRIIIDGHDIAKLSMNQRADLRNQLIGFVFQSFNLLPRLSALENVALPLRYRGYSAKNAQRNACYQIERVGLSDRLHHRPADLSGGQRQRVAIARALVGEPSLILADEPTGNLDSSTACEIMDVLLDLNRLQGVTLVMVTHDFSLAQMLRRKLVVQSGQILSGE
ncbi:ABC transporter ATP-binding protein [Ectopseudomonas alcaliphila]|uniref:ABC transporter ATP-binding protein n=1 Tax=Ectopseudomonas alcaliphila TaxID=101564 RepID=UPI002788F390|nr:MULTISPECIES: ABC transporter ATP-binding protein [Pseudomonas]MDP9942732.1 putative ABC transport system ATP-binding protein [Pseudomonas sp. 3400]MDR7014930.1 putative ABC transport system ATP-binding protein [Pseudomonas alcaliphila]